MNIHTPKTIEKFIKKAYEGVIESSDKYEFAVGGELSEGHRGGLLFNESLQTRT